MQDVKSEFRENNNNITLQLREKSQNCEIKVVIVLFHGRNKNCDMSTKNLERKK